MMQRKPLYKLCMKVVIQSWLQTSSGIIGEWVRTKTHYINCIPSTKKEEHHKERPADKNTISKIAFLSACLFKYLAYFYDFFRFIYGPGHNIFGSITGHDASHI